MAIVVRPVEPEYLMLGIVFKRNREKYGWTQAIVGKAVGVSTHQVGSYEGGHSRLPLFVIVRLLKNSTFRPVAIDFLQELTQ